MVVEGLIRRAILGLAANPLVARAVARHGLSVGAARFVAGETVGEAIAAVRVLNGSGLKATLDALGESVASIEVARRAAESYLELLDLIAAERVDANVSLKLTQMGLRVDPGRCRAHAESILRRAAAHGNFVRIDMESSEHTQATIDLFKALRRDFTNVGLVIQAYLRRSQADLADLHRFGAGLTHPGINLRMCKGAYKEPPHVAYPRNTDVDANFLHLIESHLASGNHTAIATHDPSIIDAVLRYVDRESVARDRFEFQMLYGIRRDLQSALVGQGYAVRVYVPFGTEWYAYFTRRLAERPANLWFFLGSLARERR